VGVFERKRSHFGAKVNLSRNLKEIPRIGTSHIRDAANLTLSPQKVIVVELRNAVEVDRIDHSTPLFLRLKSAAITTSPAGANVIARSSSTGGLSFSLPTQAAPSVAANFRCDAPLPLITVELL